MDQTNDNDNLYYEILTPPKSGAIVIIQEFPPREEVPPTDFGSGIPLIAHGWLPAHNGVIGVAHLSFGVDADPQIKALGGWQEPAHYGPEGHEHFIKSSWLFPIERKEEVLAFIHRYVEEIDARYELRRASRDQIISAIQCQGIWVGGGVATAKLE